MSERGEAFDAAREASCEPHALLTNHNGDPQCLCGFMSPPVTGVVAAASIVAKHVGEAARG